MLLQRLHMQMGYGKHERVTQKFVSLRDVLFVRDWSH